MTDTQTPTVSFEALARAFAVGIHSKAHLLDTAPLTRAQRSALLSSMTQDLRKLCDALVPADLTPHVSEAAGEQAAAMGIDLTQCGWNNQKQFDPHRSIFHLEHCETVLSLRTACLNCTDVQSMVDMLGARLAVAWVLKSEDAELNRLGFKQVRTDWRAAYERAGIRLLAPAGMSLPR